ncbi:MAG TPA: hypothetical protein VMW69_07565, partial [Spirochaetia bacterium]|nr:hypothetical protein [Spirochaetia bacterium]
LTIDQSISRSPDGSYEWKQMRSSGMGAKAETSSESAKLGKSPPNAPSLEMAWLLVGLSDWGPGDRRVISFLGADGSETHTAEVSFLQRGSTEIRGVPARTTTLEVSEAEGDSKAILGENYHLLIADGHLAEIIPSSTTAIGRIIIGTQAEARRDLPTRADSPDEARVRSAASSFWVAMFTVDGAAFDRLVDFDAFKSQLALRDPKVSALNLQQIRDSFIEGARKSSEGMSKDDLAHVGDMANLLVSLSDIRVAGSIGEVIGPAGSGLPTLRFQKEHDGEWRLVWMEGFR